MHGISKCKENWPAPACEANTVENTKLADTLYWNKYKCEKVGAATFETWLASGNLKYIKDEVTGSDAEHTRIYMIPKSWMRHAQGQKDEQLIEIEGVAAASEFDNFQFVRDSLFPDGSGRSSSCHVGGAAVPVKTEKQTAEDIQKVAAAVFESEKSKT